MHHLPFEDGFREPVGRLLNLGFLRAGADKEALGSF
jgi:hypothetical protein